MFLWVADDGGVSSEDDFSGGETEVQDDGQMKGEDSELKERLLRKYGNHISSLKLEFSKKKKKGKLPKEARQILLEWWSVHYKWPYPTVSFSSSSSSKHTSYFHQKLFIYNYIYRPGSLLLHILTYFKL